MKNSEELKSIKEAETVSKKLAELNDEELMQVSGGFENSLPYVKGSGGNLNDTALKELNEK